MTHRPEEEEEDTVDTDFEFDFTHLGTEPVALLPKASPGHPTTILMRRDELLPTRWRHLTN
ncbi:hypothetical protein [Streptomyces sp. ITFR-16]|uniref:hypothetical protein n=1 Tax=Streptomyces sp. ITFR-16 TaxID=3075198 RepID=UPI00288C2EFE|nr:hypothetical protein [Streptomyces sp. ITFR-16]WNI27316.1 hypothetical protein RLT58_35860 [Streptomyces sp. ITFR-16]